MITYPFNFDAENLEIFPPDIWKDPLVVYHGTSLFHSANIERDGFTRGYSPFDLQQAKELVRFLELSDVKPFDIPQGIGMTQAKTLNDYIIGIERRYFRLSFSCLSYQCVLFAAGQSKGGQTLGTVRKAREIIDKAIEANAIPDSAITKPISDLFHLAEVAEHCKGVVYAIKLQTDLNNITIENKVVYSSSGIPVDLVIGKVIIPDYFDTNSVGNKVIGTKLSAKLEKPNGLGVLLYRKHSDD